MFEAIRKRIGGKTTIVLLSTFLFLFLISSITFAEPGRLGDVNDDGEIDVRDVVLVMRHVLEIEELDQDQEKYADVNCDGEIDVRDVTLIMQYVLDIIDEFPCDLPEVVSVKAIDRNTIEVELSVDVDEDTAENVDFYQVTVGNESVVVDDIDYDEDDRIATLEVDMSGKSGVLVVNGVEAEDEVPAEPVFTGISAVEGSRDFVLEFNTPVYEKNPLRKALDFEVKVEGITRSIDEIDIPDSKQDAEDEFTITVVPTGRPDAFDSIIITIKASGADRIANVWDETLSELTVRSTTAQKDDDPPRFEGITAYDDSSFVIAHFSEPVNTSDQNIGLGAGTTQVWVTGERPDGTPLEFTAGDGIDALGQDEELKNLRIDLGETVPKGSVITVRLGVTAGSRIEDRAGNSLVGTHTRSTTSIPGPTLKDAEVSNLIAGTVDQKQTFKVTLVGDMDEEETIDIDLSEVPGEVDYSTANADYDVDGADGRVTIDNDVITFEAREDISNGTVLTITAEGIDVNVPDPDDAEDIEVTFERSEIGAKVTAEFDILSGLKDLEVEASYERRDDRTDEDSTTSVGVLGSGQDDHTVEFIFTLTTDLDEDENVEIDLSDLISAGVSFTAEDPEVSLNGNPTADVSTDMRTSRIIVTAEDDLSANDTIKVTVENVDVAQGSAKDDVEVTFTRSDSGLSFLAYVDIGASFVDVEVLSVEEADNQDVLITFTIDGRMGFWNTVRIDLDYDGDLGFESVPWDEVVTSHGRASMSDQGVVTFRATDAGGLSDGTEVTIEIYGAIDASGASDGLVLFRRGDSRYEAVDVLEVIN